MRLAPRTRADRQPATRPATRDMGGATGRPLPVEAVLTKLAQEPDLAGVLAHHPELTADEVRACLAYAAIAVRDRQRSRPQGRGWCALKAAATMSLLGHAILALSLLGSFSLEATKPDSPDDPVGSICDRRFEMLKEATPIAIPLCLNRETLADADTSIRTAVLVIHGSARNGVSAQAAIERATAGSGSRDVLIVAPQFPTKEDLDGRDPRPDVLAWRPSDWSQGDRADAPVPAARVSSFEVLDMLIAEIGTPDRYPNLQDIIVAGHSGGGQFVHRYAAGTRIEQDPSLAERGIQVRYLVANPSSYLYMFPIDYGPQFAGCRGVDNYKYGLNDLNTYMRATGSETIQASYSQKDVTILLGRLDHAVIDPSKDDSCEGLAQGAHRLSRGIRFVGALDDYYGAGDHHTRFVIVPGVGHSASGIFNSPEGRSALLEADRSLVGSGSD